MKFLAATLTASLLAAAAPPAHADWAPVADFEAKLHAGIAGGGLDQATASLYRLYAVTAADRLPRDLRVETGEKGLRRRDINSPLVLRCGTPFLRGARARLDELSAEDRRVARSILEPPPASASRAAAQDGGKAITHRLANHLLTENFSVEWGPNLTNEDGSTPVRDADANGVPDVVETWATLFEASFAGVATVLDPLDPASVFAGTAILTNRVPVYLGNSDPTTSVENISPGTYAFTQEDSPIPFIVVNNDLTFVPPNQDPEGDIPGAMKITASHEFFHVLHFEYEPSVWQPTNDDWWLEASSTWMEDEVFDVVDDYLQYLEPKQGSRSWADFVEAGLPVPFTDPNYVVRAYGSVIFAKYLSEHVSGRASMSEVWDVIRGPPGARILGALEQYAASKGLGGLKELFLGFAGTNATMDYEDGPAYESVPVRSNTLTRATVTTNLPFYLGATYASQAGLVGDRAVALSGSPSVPWGLSLVVSRQGYDLVLGSIAPAGATQIAVSSLRATDRVFAAVSFLEPTPSSDGGDTGTGGGGSGGGGCFVRELARAEPLPRTAALATPVSYSTAVVSATNPDGVPPSAPRAVVVSPAPGGADLAWLPATDDRLVIGGYVVRWRRANSADAFSSRTLPGPVTAIEVRGLAGATLYEAEVFAYDEQGNESPSTTTAFSTP